jgi:hypothetical protein
MSSAKLLTALVLAAGCTGSFDGKTYRGDGFGFRIGEPPASWQRIQVTDTPIAYRDDQRQATIAVNGRCGKDGEDVPLVALTQHLFLLFTEREVTTQTLVPLDGREALQTVISAKLDGVKKTVEVWVMKKDGCVYDLIYVAEPSAYEHGVPDFRRFASSFATLPR